MTQLNHNVGGELTYRGDTKAVSVVTLKYWRYDKLTACGDEAAIIYFAVCDLAADPPAYLRVKNTNYADCWRRYARTSSSLSSCGSSPPSPAYWYDATRRTAAGQDYIETEESVAPRQLQITVYGTYNMACRRTYGDNECEVVCNHTVIALDGVGTCSLLARTKLIQVNPTGSVPFCGAGGYPVAHFFQVTVNCDGTIYVENSKPAICSTICNNDNLLLSGLTNNTDDECEYSGSVPFYFESNWVDFTIALI